MRQTNDTNKIAILATGDEIITGDILNSNTQIIAKLLTDANMACGIQIATTDSTDEISTAINYLLKKHRGIIITGGLGPTSDDITRFGLAKALDLSLVFNRSAWSEILNLFKKYDIKKPPESNRQQALFPENSIILPNTEGSAAGCYLNHNEKHIFMLPGPPSECMPMMHSHVLNLLDKARFSQAINKRNWLLLGVSEGQTAEKLDAIAHKYGCKTGYRISYPYLEFKLFDGNNSNFHEAAKTIEKTIMPYLIGNGLEKASDWLINKLIKTNKPITIFDQATHGLLESTLKTPQTYSLVKFINNIDQADISITGLMELWLQKKVPHTSIKISINKPIKHEINKQVPLRGIRSKHYAIEIISHAIGNILYNKNS